MNIIDIQDDLKNLPEQALMREMQQPTGSAPQFLVLGELKRRKQMRDDYKRQQNADMKTVAEEVVTAAGAPQEGIMQMARSLNPNTNMAQDTGLAQATPVTPTQAPQPQAPQMMSDGGIMRLQTGGYPDDLSRLVGSTIDYRAGSADSMRGYTGNNINANVIDAYLRGELDPSFPSYDDMVRAEKTYGKDKLREISSQIVNPFGRSPFYSSRDEITPGMSQADAIATRRRLAGGAGIGSVSADVADFDATSDAGSGFGSNIEYTYDTFLNENSLNDSPQAREMFSNYKSYMDTRDPPSDPQLFSAMNFDESPQGLTSVSSQAVDFMPRSGEFTRPELSDSPQILNELSVEPDADFARQTSPSELLSGPFSNVPRFNPDSLQGAVDRDRELTPEERYTQRESSLLQDQMLALGFTGGDIDPSPFSTVTADPSIDYSSLPISTLNRLADEGDDSAINQLRLNEISGLQTQSDISTGGDDLYMDSIMRGTLGQGRSDAAYAASLYNPSDISNAQNTITSLEEYLRLNPGNPQAEAQLAQARDQLIQAETSRDTSIALQDIVPSTTPRRSEFQAFDATAADVEAVDAEDATGGGPNLVIQDEVISTSEAENRREAAEDGGGITSLRPVVSDDQGAVVSDDDAGGSTTSSGGSYGSIESRIAKMLSDRESSAEADKWMALAQTGMALMASKNPTFGGALGEAGLAGVGALQKSRKAYDSDIMSLLGMQQKIQSAKSLDAARSAKSTSGGSKELDRMIDNARADLSLAIAAAEKYFKVTPGDPASGTEDRMINMTPPDVQANVIAARDRLEALNRIAIGGGTQFDATQ